MNCHCEEREKGAKDRSITVEEGKAVFFFFSEAPKAAAKEPLPEYLLLFPCFLLFCFFYIFFSIFYIHFSSRARCFAARRARGEEGRKKEKVVCCLYLFWDSFSLLWLF